MIKSGTGGGDVVAAITMFLLFAAGYGIPFVAAGTVFGSRKQTSGSKKMATTFLVVKIIMSVAVVAIGVYLIWEGVIFFIDGL